MEQASLDGQARGLSRKRNRPLCVPEELLIVNEMKCDFAQLVSVIELLPMLNHNHQTLPAELFRKIASYHTLKRVEPSQVQAVRASSTMGDSISLSDVLNASDDSTWWMSRRGSMPRGHGREWVHFQLASKEGVRRLSGLEIKIPPIPMGPLSVREFYLESRIKVESRVVNNNNVLVEEWVRISPNWMVENKTGLQRFELLFSVDATDVRLICLSNQISTYLGNGADDDLVDRFDSVGMYAVVFH
jgi:hypothetical protein